MMFMEENEQPWRLGGPERFECRMCRLQISNIPQDESVGGGLAIYLILSAAARRPSIYLILGRTPPPRIHPEECWKSGGDTFGTQSPQGPQVAKVTHFAS